MISYPNRQSLFGSQLSYKTVVLSYSYGITYSLIVLRYLLKIFRRLDLFTFSGAIVMIYRCVSHLSNTTKDKVVPTTTGKRQKMQ